MLPNQYQTTYLECSQTNTSQHTSSATKPIPEYIPRVLPNQYIDEAVNRFQIQTGRDSNSFDKNEQRHTTGRSRRTCGHRDKDIPHPAAAKQYFIETIVQYKTLYDDSSSNSLVNRKLSAIENYFRAPSRTAVEWTNIGGVVIYGGLNTGVKFSVYLEYFVLPIEKRPKTTPPYYELLTASGSQTLQFNKGLPVEQHNALQKEGVDYLLIQKSRKPRQNSPQAPTHILLGGKDLEIFIRLVIELDIFYRGMENISTNVEHSDRIVEALLTIALTGC